MPTTNYDLIEPFMDKGWSFQIKTSDYSPLDPIIRESLLSLINTPLVRRAKPFLQGDTECWLMVEFWTDNEDHIIAAANFLNESLKV